MPHIYLELSDNILEKTLAPDFFPRLHQRMSELGPFDIRNMKSRIERYSEYCVSDGSAQAAFIHTRVYILSGRDPAIKIQLSKGLQQFIEKEFSLSLSKLNCFVTVDIRDIDKESYSSTYFEVGR